MVTAWPLQRCWSTKDEGSMPHDDFLLCVYAPSRTAIEKQFALYGGRILLFRSSASSSTNCHDALITCALIWTLQAASGLITQRSMRWASLIVSCFCLNCTSVHCSGATLPPADNKLQRKSGQRSCVYLLSQWGSRLLSYGQTIGFAWSTFCKASR